MPKFDSKTFNPQAFGHYVARIPNTTKTELAKSGAVGSNENARNALATQTGSLYSRVPYFGRISGGTSQNKAAFEKIKETFATHVDVNSQVSSIYSDLNNIVGSIVDSKLSDFHNTISSEINGKIQAALSSVYKINGSKTFAQLTQMYSYIPPQAIPSIIGEVYNVTDAFTTTDSFVEGAGKEYPAGTNVVIVANGSDAFKFDVL